MDESEAWSCHKLCYDRQSEIKSGVMGRYANALVRFPYLFILFDVLAAGLTGPLTIWFYGIPELQPTKGFDARGTEIAGWMYTAQFIEDHLANGSLRTGDQHTNMSHHLQGTPAAQDWDTEFPVYFGIEYFRGHPRLVIRTVEKDKSLLSADTLRAVCQLQQLVESWCRGKCHTLSLGSVAATHLNISCDDLTTPDVAAVSQLLQECSEFFQNGSLTIDCSHRACYRVPGKCTAGNFVYQVLDQLADKRFMKNGNSVLELSIIYLVWNGTVSELRQLYIDHLQQQLSNDEVEVVAMDLNIVEELFQWFVVQDFVWYAIAMALVVLILLAYLRSVILMVTVILNVVFSMSLGYWFYFMICRFTFFPFINMLAALLLIAVGADDLFIFCDIWRDQKRMDPEVSAHDVVTSVLERGGISVLVTSFTTAAALLANLVNDVTAIRCFGTFSAICVFMNFVLFITWVPAILVIIERSNCCERGNSCKGKQCYNNSVCEFCSTRAKKVWSSLIPAVVSKGAPYLLTVLTSLSCLSLVGVFWKPGLGLPSSTDPRVLIPSHPFTKYTWEIKNHFHFESHNSLPLTAKYIWGVDGRDHGNPLDANDNGYLVYDEDFSLNELTQVWLKDFCQKLLLQEFIDPDFASKSHCYWNILEHYATKACDTSNGTCCGLAFPIKTSMVYKCMRDMVYASLTLDNITSQTYVIGQPLFDNNDQVKVFQLTFKTKYSWDSDFSNMDNTYQTLSEFSKGEMKSAPLGLDTGWFVGAHIYEFGFYNLELALAAGAVSGLGVSLAVGFVVLLLTTLNLVLTLYAVLTICFVLAITAAVLVLLGWELGVSEALTLTLSTGLSIDVTIHLGVAYKLAPVDTAPHKVQYALDTVGPAVTMAIVTTFAAGAALMMARVWAFHVFGTFLVVTMVCSWVYGIFFFLAVCLVWGPTGSVGNLLAICRSKEPGDKMALVNNGKEAKASQINSNKDIVQNGVNTANSNEKASIDHNAPDMTLCRFSNQSHDLLY